MNKNWHNKNILGQNASLRKRIAWHITHQENCGCRSIPETVQREIRKSKLTTPKTKSKKL
ncbi:MAG: hypothetical protein HY840_03060 [Bacteroidetes bacterium]|nr:hypothetical protein [Bacteroidota bacterium]